MLFHRIGDWRVFRLSLTAAIIQQETIMPGESFRLESPTDGSIHNDAIIKHQHRLLCRAVQLIIQLNAIHMNFGHVLYFYNSISLLPGSYSTLNPGGDPMVSPSPVSITHRSGRDFGIKVPACSGKYAIDQNQMDG